MQEQKEGYINLSKLEFDSYNDGVKNEVVFRNSISTRKIPPSALEAMFSFVKILVLLAPVFGLVLRNYGSFSVCSKNCQCSVCPITGLENLTEISCNTSNLREIEVPSRNICSM